MRWLITREAGDASAEVARLVAAGVDARAVPCIEVVSRPLEPWPPAPGAAMYVLTSRRAAQRMLDEGEPMGLIAAMAPATLELLQRHAVPVEVHARGGAVALADAVVAWWDATGRPAVHLRYPSSDVGQKAAEQAQAVEVLSLAGPVLRQAVYQTRPVEQAPRMLAAEGAGGDWAVCVASPSAMEVVLAAAKDVPSPPRHVVCLGRSTREAFERGRPPGWPPGHLTPSLIDTIVSLGE